eukprot:1355027-Pyramimonas_sp.AAC.1
MRGMFDCAIRPNVAFDLIPKGAQLSFGLMERKHAVRRGQLSKCHMLFPDDSLKTALMMTSSQLIALWNACRPSPSTLMLGAQPDIS